MATTKAEAPERIWLDHNDLLRVVLHPHTGSVTGAISNGQSSQAMKGVVEYIRADLVADLDPAGELVSREAEAVRELGKRIGLGNMMNIARDEWRKLLGEQAGGEFAVGPCVALTVPCGCDYPCDWCNGAKWITPKVAELRAALPPVARVPVEKEEDNV